MSVHHVWECGGHDVNEHEEEGQRERELTHPNPKIFIIVQQLSTYYVLWKVIRV